MFSNIGPFQLLIVLLIVALIFGTKKLRSLGSDVGGAVKGFRSAMNGDDNDEKETPSLTQAEKKTEDAASESSADAHKTSS